MHKVTLNFKNILNSKTKKDKKKYRFKERKENEVSYATSSMEINKIKITRVTSSAKFNSKQNHTIRPTDSFSISITLANKMAYSWTAVKAVTSLPPF